MDSNKRDKLEKIGYCIDAACGSCTYGSFTTGNDFGVCGLHTYEHQKHTENPRQLSIHRYGSCQDYRLRPYTRDQLGAFAEFLFYNEERGP